MRQLESMMKGFLVLEADKTLVIVHLTLGKKPISGKWVCKVSISHMGN